MVVSGVTDEQPTTLTFAGEGPSVELTGDGRCGPLSVGSGTCEVTGSTTTYDFTAVAAPDGSSALVFTVSADGVADAEPGNNSARVPLLMNRPAWGRKEA